MKIVDRAVYYGPNLYARFPVIRLRLDLGELEEWPTGAARERLHRRACWRRCPARASTAARYGEPGGFLRRLTEGRRHLARARARARRDRAPEHRRPPRHLRQDRDQRRAGPVRRRLRVRAGGGRPRGRQAGARPAPLLLPRERSGPTKCATFDFERERDCVHPLRPAPRPRAEHRRARARGEGAGHPLAPAEQYSLVQLGHGKYQRRIQATVTSETRHIAVEIASDKEETNRILATSACPSPSSGWSTARRGGRAAERIGYPVVVKPLNANHGRGVSIHLDEPSQVARPSRTRGSTAAPSSSRASSRASTTGCWSSTAS